MTEARRSGAIGPAPDAFAGESTGFRLGEWRVDPMSRQVTNGHVLQSLSPRAMGVLTCLAQVGGAVVTRDQLLSAVWTDVTVTDESLTQAVAELRRVFRTGRTDVDVVGTVPKTGYRLLVGPSHDPVRSTNADEAANNLESYALVVEARRALLRGSLNAASQATMACREAALISPNSSLAQATLAYSLIHLALYGGGTRDDLVEALDASEAAVRCGPDSATGYTTLGYALSVLGRAEAANTALAKSLELGDPDGDAHYFAAAALFVQGKYRSALSLALGAADRRPDAPYPLFLAARAAARIDPVLTCRVAQSCKRLIDRRLADDPDEPRSRDTIGPIFALLGESDLAAHALSQTAGGGTICFIQTVFGYARIGATTESLDALETAIDGGYRNLGWLRREPMVDRLMTHPRFKRVTRRLVAA